MKLTNDILLKAILDLLMNSGWLTEKIQSYFVAFYSVITIINHLFAHKEVIEQ